MSIAQLSAALEKKTEPVTEAPETEETETPSEAAKAVETVEESETPKVKQEADEEEPIESPKGLKKRFAKLTTELRGLKAQLAEKQSTREATPAPATPAAVNDQPPKSEDFTDYDQYTRALTRYELKQARSEERAAEATKTNSDKWQERVKETKKTAPDFDDVMSDADVPISNVMQQMMLESEIGPRMVYELAKNPAEAKRIAQLSPIAAVKELTKLEAKLTAAAAPATPATAPKVLPKPPALVGNASTPTASNDLNDPKMSMEAFKKIAAKGLKRKTF
jgi:uncharacterized small protein (DUF1192 family)